MILTPVVRFAIIRLAKQHPGAHPYTLACLVFAAVQREVSVRQVREVLNGSN